MAAPTWKMAEEKEMPVGMGSSDEQCLTHCLSLTFIPPLGMIFILSLMCLSSTSYGFQSSPVPAEGLWAALCIFLWNITCSLHNNRQNNQTSHVQLCLNLKAKEYMNQDFLSCKCQKIILTSLSYDPLVHLTWKSRNCLASDMSGTRSWNDVPIISNCICSHSHCLPSIFPPSHSFPLSTPLPLVSLILFFFF